MPGYFFILTEINPEMETPFEIIPQHFLQKANLKQIENIRHLLKTLNPLPSLPPLYEYDAISKPASNSDNLSYRYERLPPEKWRYWIISFKESNAAFKELRFALSLMEQDIELGFQVVTMGEPPADGFMHHSQELQTYFNDPGARRFSPKKLEKNDLEFSAQCYAKFNSVFESYDHIKRAFQRFDDLRCVLMYSELSVLGLFSIIESLLTHAPSTRESADSLIRQLSHKMPLVCKRFVRPFDVSKYFGSIGEDNLWKKLYAYRSRIVHGEKTQFSQEIESLKDCKTVITFLREMVKLLLIQSLEEPVLMTDLKGC